MSVFRYFFQFYSLRPNPPNSFLLFGPHLCTLLLKLNAMLTDSAVLRDNNVAAENASYATKAKRYIKETDISRKSPYTIVGKRIADMAISMFVIVFVLSWLIPVMAIVIWAETKSGPFFIQMRSGRYGELYACIKFRTMFKNDEADTKAAVDGDSRITKAGRLMRISGIDELPQFINVLKGEMSLIGPRPHMLEDNRAFRAIVEGYDKRHLVRPGITGLSQVKGFKGPIHNHDDLFQRVENDIRYVQHYSFSMDVKIILQTFRHIAGELTKS